MIRYQRQHRAARSDGRRAGALSAGGGVVGHHRGRVGRGSGALKNGLNHGRAGVAAQHKKDTLHVANHHSYEKATLNSKSNPIRSDTVTVSLRMEYRGNIIKFYDDNIQIYNARRNDPLYPASKWNVHEATLKDGVRTNNQCETWNNGFRHLHPFGLHWSPSRWMTPKCRQH